MTCASRLVGIVLAAVGLAGCVTSQARTTPELPPLEVPAVPPRIVAPPAPREIPPPELDVMPPAPVMDGLPEEAEPPTEARQREAEEPPGEPVELFGPERPPPSDERPPLRLPSEAGDDGAMGEQVRAQLVRARDLLARVDRGGLSEGGREQLATSERFISQAESALQAENLVFASYLADKAETLARALAGG